MARCNATVHWRNSRIFSLVASGIDSPLCGPNDAVEKYYSCRHRAVNHFEYQAHFLSLKVTVNGCYRALS